MLGRVRTERTRAQGSATPPAGATHRSEEKGLVLRFLDWSNPLHAKNPEQREAERSRRREASEALIRAFPEIVASSAALEEKIRTLHAIQTEEPVLRGVHKLGALLFRGGYQPGRYRKGPNRVGSYLAPRASDVPALMNAVCERIERLLREAGSDQDVRLVAAFALWMIIAIHPFPDGNGRTGRALLNLVLANGGRETIDFPANNAVYHRSRLWKETKLHLISFIHELGWNLRKGSVPPRGYFRDVHDRLEARIAGASLRALREDEAIQRIAEAIDEMRSARKSEP